MSEADKYYERKRQREIEVAEKDNDELLIDFFIRSKHQYNKLYAKFQYAYIFLLLFRDLVSALIDIADAIRESKPKVKPRKVPWQKPL